MIHIRTMSAENIQKQPKKCAENAKPDFTLLLSVVKLAPPANLQTEKSQAEKTRWLVQPKKFG